MKLGSDYSEQFQNRTFLWRSWFAGTQRAPLLLVGTSAYQGLHVTYEYCIGSYAFKTRTQADLIPSVSARSSWHTTMPRCTGKSCSSCSSSNAELACAICVEEFSDPGASFCSADCFRVHFVFHHHVFRTTPDDSPNSCRCEPLCYSRCSLYAIGG